MPDRIRVFMIATGFYIEGRSGGVGRYAVELCQALDREQVDLTLCGLWHYGTEYEAERIERLKAEGIEAVTAANWIDNASARNVYGAFRGLRELLAGRPVDIVHSHSEFADFMAAVLGRWQHVPVTMRTLHNHEWRRRPLLRPIARTLYPALFDIEVGVSPHVVASLNNRPLARLLKRTAVHIPAAIGLGQHDSTHVDRGAKRASLGIPTEAAIVGTVGRLSRQKDHTLFLQAARLTLDVVPNAYFLLVGDGEDELRLKSLAEALGLADRVLFTGPRGDVEELLKIMDVFVSSARWEGLPLVVLESLAAGTPVVATDIPGNRDLIEDGVNGTLVSSREPAALAEKIAGALRSPEHSAAMARTARQRVAEYSIERAATQYEAIYSETPAHPASEALVAEPTYIIIGGTAKAGTTSVFTYLADHPDICASHVKETGFFLDADYPAAPNIKFRFADGLDNYQTYFDHCRGEPFRLEATHTYLYSPGTPARIKASLPQTKLIFLLRDPIDRLVSYYRFAKQQGRFPAHLSFDEFIEAQQRHSEWAGNRAMAEGRYSTYLKPYLDLFGPERICVLQFEALARDTRGLLDRICQFIGVDSAPYRNYRFHIHNQTRTIRNAALHRQYLALRRRTSRRLVAGLPGASAAVPGLRLRLERLYFWLNSRADERVLISPEMMARLGEYYREEPRALAPLLEGDALAWPWLNERTAAGAATHRA